MIIGTAGHVNHGKTSLIQALTGIHTDRLKVEKERGMTIELGYAPLVLPDNERVGIIDVPGHECFIKTMVRGATAMDLVLLVIALNEGIKPQTREHVNILTLLHVKRGIVILTKTDLVPDAEKEEKVLKIRNLLNQTFLSEAPIIKTVLSTGEGIGILKTEIAKQHHEINAEKKHLERKNGPLRIPVDRIFTLKGIGTTVTGTLISGTIDLKDEIEIYPQGITATLREIQAYHKTAEKLFAPSRISLNIRNVSVEQLQRGSVIGHVQQLKVVHSFYAKIRFLKEMKGNEYMIHMGTMKTEAHLKKIDSQGKYLIKCADPVIVLPGDRFILRRDTTIGGGEVIDKVPSPVLTISPAITKDIELIQKITNELMLYPLGKNRWELLDLEMIHKTKFSAVSLSVIREVVQELLRSDVWIRIHSGLYVKKDQFDFIKKTLCAYFEKYQTLSIADLKTLSNLSRKYVIPYLEFFDAVKWTLRVGDVRKKWLL